MTGLPHEPTPAQPSHTLSDETADEGKPQDVQVEHSKKSTLPMLYDGINKNTPNDERQALYDEAIEQYGEDGSIDPVAEKKLVRKIDARVIPILGICYFFYYVDKTTLSYAAIFGIKDDLKLVGTEYSWLSSIFYFGWLLWAIPSNLIMQRSPPSYYLAFNITMWGVLLMCQAASRNFATLAALRVISGAFEAIADPA